MAVTNSHRPAPLNNPRQNFTPIPQSSQGGSGGDKSSLVKFLNVVRGIGSALFGIPAAVAATIVVGTVFAIVSAARIAELEFRRSWGSPNVKVESPGLLAASEFLWGAMGKIWTGFGIYAPLQLAKQFEKRTEEWESELGLGNSASDPTSHESLVSLSELQKEGSLKCDIDRQIDKVSAGQFGNTPNFTREEMEEWLKWINHAPDENASEQEMNDWLEFKIDGEQSASLSRTVNRALAESQHLAKHLQEFVTSYEAKDGLKLEEAKRGIKEELKQILRPSSHPKAPFQAISGRNLQSGGRS